MWELNPPMQLLTTITGFEDQRAHQHPSTPIEPTYYIIKYLQFQHYFYCFFGQENISGISLFSTYNPVELNEVNLWFYESYLIYTN